VGSGERGALNNSFFEFNQLFEIYSFFENTQNMTRFVFYLIFTFFALSYSNMHINIKIKSSEFNTIALVPRSVGIL